MAYLLFDIVLLLMSIIARLLAFVCLFFSIVNTSAYKLGNFGLLSRDFRHVCIIQARRRLPPKPRSAHAHLLMCVRVGLSAQMAACILRILYHAPHSNDACLPHSAQMVAFILCILVRASF